ncbi:MAG: hypothetical protein U0452_04125 [Anaerolineae bacterium]
MTGETSSSWELARQVQAKYQDMLLALPHVVGVAVGIATEGGQSTGEPALIVMVDTKVPPDGLSPAELIPPHLDGVRVDVQEFGAFSAM